MIVTITADIPRDPLLRVMAALNDALPVMRAVAGVLQDATDRAFLTRRDPATGAPWKPLSAATVARRALAGRSAENMLQYSGRLVSGIHSEVGPTFARVGTNIPYAAIHHFGGRTPPHIIRPRRKRALAIPGIGLRSVVHHPGSSIPSRPFFGINERDRQAIADIFARNLGRALHGGA